MASLVRTYRYLQHSKFGCEMERCVAMVGKIWIVKILRVVLDDSLE